MNQIILRKASEQDVDVLISIESELAGQKTYSAMTEKVEWLEEIVKGEVYIIVEAGVSVGDVSYQPKEGGVYISGLVVRPDFQGRGIGKLVLEMVLEKLKDESRIWLVVHPENERALSMYKSFGFKMEERRENYYGDGEPRLILVKES